MDQHTSTDSDALLSLIQQVKENYHEPPPSPPKRGKRRDFSALSFLLLAVVAITTRTFRDSELCQLLSQDERLRRALLFERIPHRTTIGRRMAALVPEAEEHRPARPADRRRGQARGHAVRGQRR